MEIIKIAEYRFSSRAELEKFLKVAESCGYLWKSGNTPTKYDPLEMGMDCETDSIVLYSDNTMMHGPIEGDPVTFKNKIPMLKIRDVMKEGTTLYGVYKGIGTKSGDEELRTITIRNIGTTYAYLGYHTKGHLNHKPSTEYREGMCLCTTEDNRRPGKIHWYLDEASAMKSLEVVADLRTIRNTSLSNLSDEAITQIANIIREDLKE